MLPFRVMMSRGVAGISLALTLALGGPVLAEGDDSPNVASLISQLKDNDLQTRRDAAFELARLTPPPKEAIPGLVEVLKDRDVQVRNTALDALAMMGPEAKEAALPVGELLSHYDRQTRYRAAYAVGRIGPDTMPAIEKAIKGKTPARSACVMALGWMEERIPPRGVEILVERLGDGDATVALEASEALAEVGKPAEAKLLATASHTNPKIRAGIALALIGLDFDRAKSIPVLQKLASDSDALVRQQALVSLGASRKLDDKTRDLLIKGLQDGAPAVQQAARDGLALTGSQLEAVTPTLIKLLNSDKPGVPDHAAYLLGRVGKQASPALLASLSEEGIPRDAVISALVGIGGSGEGALLAGLKESDPKIRSGAAEALAGIRPVRKAQVDALIGALSDRDVAVRREAARSLGVLGTGAAKAKEGLAKLQADSDASVRQVVIVSLGSIGIPEVELAKYAQKGMKDAKLAVVEASLRSIAKPGGGTPELAAAVGELLKHKDPAVRTQAIETLGAFGLNAKDQVGAIIAALSDTDSSVRLAAALNIWRFPGFAQGAVVPLAKLLKDPDPAIRAAATRGIVQIKAPGDEVAPYVVEMMEDPENSVRTASLEAMADLKSYAQIGVPRLLELAEKDVKMRDATARLAAGRISPIDPELVPIVVKHLDSKYWQVQVMAIYLLVGGGKASQPELPRLEALAKNEKVYRSAREAAEKAIPRIQNAKR